jgi:hypothetical protein
METYTQDIMAESISSAAYWKLRVEKDSGEETTNPHLLAARIIKSGQPITQKVVNTVLTSQDISVTQEQLDELTSLPFEDYSLNPDMIKDVVTAHPRNARPGEYA